MMETNWPREQWHRWKVDLVINDSVYFHPGKEMSDWDLRLAALNSWECLHRKLDGDFHFLSPLCHMEWCIMIILRMNHNSMPLWILARRSCIKIHSVMMQPDAVSCLLVCYLILKTHVSLSELDNKTLYTLRHVHRVRSFLLYPLSLYHHLCLEVNGSRVCKDKMWEVYRFYWTLYKLGNLILKCGMTLQETRYVTTATDHHLHSLTGQRTSYEHRPDKNTQGQSSLQRRDSIDN